MKYEYIAEKVAVFITAMCIIFLASLVLALPLLWLWNATMPELFGLKEITWWMAWKLMLLSSILFKNFFSASKSS
jgi:hypothetical protein